MWHLHTHAIRTLRFHLFILYINELNAISCIHYTSIHVYFSNVKSVPLSFQFSFHSYCQWLVVAPSGMTTATHTYVATHVCMQTDDHLGPPWGAHVHSHVYHSLMELSCRFPSKWACKRRCHDHGMRSVMALMKQQTETIAEAICMC